MAEPYNYKASSDCLGALHNIKLKMTIKNPTPTIIETVQQAGDQIKKILLIFELKTPNQYTIYSKSPKGYD